MKETIIGIYEAKTHLSKYLRRVASGEEEIVIASAGKPVAKLVGYDPPSSPRKPGLLKGKLTIADDFDELPPEFVEAFG